MVILIFFKNCAIIFEDVISWAYNASTLNMDLIFLLPLNYLVKGFVKYIWFVDLTMFNCILINPHNFMY